MVMRWGNDVSFPEIVRFAETAVSENLGLVIFLLFIYFFKKELINMRKTTAGKLFRYTFRKASWKLRSC